MGRKDWDYITIPIEMSAALDEIIKRNGRRYGIYDKVQLVRQLTADFITKYDQDNSIPEAKKHVEEKHSWTDKDVEEKKDWEEVERKLGRGKVTSLEEAEEVATYDENETSGT